MRTGKKEVKRLNSALGKGAKKGEAKLFMLPREFF